MKTRQNKNKNMASDLEVYDGYDEKIPCFKPKIHDTYEMSIYKFPGFKRKVTINVELRAKKTQQQIFYET
jgi:hypothetical protein